MAAQTVSRTAHTPTVSDWSHHHLLYPESWDASVTARIKSDPRWLQNWYLRHSEAWWPQRRRWHRRKDRRDWSFPLGVAYYEPLFDGTFTFSVTDSTSGQTETGLGTFSAADYGNGELLATAGSVTLTGGADLGTYGLYPGDPDPVYTISPAGAFYYDNIFLPGQNPAFDGYGPLFLGSGLEVNLWGNGPDNYSFYIGTGGSTYPVEINGTGTVTLGVDSNPDPGGGQAFPSKFTFDLNAVPSCTSDFVVMGIPTTRTLTSQANIVGLNNLYSNPGGSGYCPGTGPAVMFAYGSGTGQVPGSVVISQNGTQVAFIENTGSSSYFHVLTIGTTGTNGTDATDPVMPGGGGGNNAVDLRVQLSPDGGTTTQGSTNSPFVLYTFDDANDVAYATTYSMAGSGSGYLYKIGNVFNGGAAPTIIWSVPIAAVPSTPVYDRVSGNVFFTDSAGNIDYVTDLGITALPVVSTLVASGATSENPVIVDGTDEMVYAFFNTNGTNAVVVQAPTTMTSFISVPVGTGSTTYTGPYLVDFNNAWYSRSGTPLMFVAGTGTGTLPTLYSVGFTGNVMNNTASASAPLATGSADSSPVTEFYNATLGKDFLFVGVTDNCIATTGGGTAGCVMSLDITNGLPTIGAGTTALPAAGGPSGIISDNDSNLPEASSIYYATKNGSTLVKATQSGLN